MTKSGNVLSAIRHLGAKLLGIVTNEVRGI